MTPQGERSDDVERVARAIYDDANKGLNNCWQWDDSELEVEYPGTRARYLLYARAALAALSTRATPSAEQKVGEDVRERIARALCNETFRIPAEKCPLWQLHLDDADKAIAALPAPPTLWMDIETAPRDGTHVLVMLDDNLPPTTAHWFGPADLPGLRSGGWYLSVQQHEGPRIEPTHWQPLPAPPTSSRG